MKVESGTKRSGRKTENQAQDDPKHEPKDEKSHFSVTKTSSGQVDAIKTGSSQLYSLLTQEISDQITKKYHEGQWTFKQLDDWRANDLATLIQKRYKDTKKTYLTKEELVLLMDWKLAKGKFRPTLPKLIKSNEEDDVKLVTEEGLGMFLDSIKPFKKGHIEDLKAYQKIVKDALKKVCELKGVGPATGSLILSTLYKISDLAPPFFSDESFEYYVLEPQRPSTSIKYNVKEYVEELIPVYVEIAKYNDINFNQIERGGWALKLYELHRLTKFADLESKVDVNEEYLRAYNVGDKTSSEPERKRQKR